MKVYHLHRQQILPVSPGDAWNFFSNPSNLARITPPSMNFRIVSNAGITRIYEGQLITYKVTALPGYTVDWVSEITEVERPNRFTDIQRIGPYARWIHTHHFKPVEAGVEMTDEVEYAIPFGWLGRLAHQVLVRRELNAIFDFRYHALEDLFVTSNNVNSQQH